MLLIFPSECSEDIIARRAKDKLINYVLRFKAALKYGLLGQTCHHKVHCMENFGQDTSAIVYPFPSKHFLLFNPNL